MLRWSKRYVEPIPCGRVVEGVWVHNDMAGATASGSESGSGSSPGISATGPGMGNIMSGIVTFGTGPEQFVKK
ncbi:MAG: hypothetical protein JJU33_04330 [Phycisphaerales bacterium]|nr:hypothetical protein [Phycisphaerales bacterium]